MRSGALAALGGTCNSAFVVQDRMCNMFIFFEDGWIEFNVIFATPVPP